MSQVQDTNATVRPKARMPHPAAAAAAQFRTETAHLRPGENGVPPVNHQPTVPPTAFGTPPGTVYQQPVAPQVPVTATSMVPQGIPQPVAASVGMPAPAPVAVQPQQPQYAPVHTMAPPPGYVDVLAHSGVSQPVQQVTPPVEPAQPSGDALLREKYERDTAELMRQLDESRAALEQAKALPEELRRIQEERELEAIIKASGIELTSIDPDDARKLMAPILSTMRKQQTDTEVALREQLAAQAKQLQERFQQLDERDKTAQLERTRQRILSVHPDLETLQKSPAYHSIMLSPVDQSSGLLVGQLVAAEFNKGNADYIISVLNKVKSTQPSLDNVASVSPSSAGITPAAASNIPEGYMTPEQLAQLKIDRQTGAVTPDAFRERMNKHREAKKHAPVN